MGLDLAAEQQQRGIHIRHAGQVAGLHRGVERQHQFGGVQRDPVVPCAQKVVHLADVGRVGPGLKLGGVEIPPVVLVPHRERLQLPTPCGKIGVRHRRDQAGIQPAGQKRRHRHITDQLPLDGIHDQIPHEVVGVVVVGQLPVAVQGQAAGVSLIHGALAGQQLSDIFKYPAPRRAAGTKQQHFGQAVGVHPGRHGRVGQQGLDLAAKQQAVPCLHVKQRLDPAAVPRQKQPARPLRPDGKGKNAVAAFQAVRPPLGEGVQQHLGIRMAGKAVALVLQRGAQFRRVVQLAIIHEGVAFALPIQLHRLQAVLNIHHRQPRMDERRPPADEHAPLVRPTAG